jgi:hypothetical protein
MQAQIQLIATILMTMLTITTLLTKKLPKLPAETTTKSKSYEIHTMLDWLEEGDRLIINDRYQRGEVGQYKPQFRTRLIESVIRGFPLPALLVMQKRDSPDELIDGQQRLRTIEAFIKGHFSLDGEHLLRLSATDYDGIFWSDLDGDHKQRIKRDYEMSVNYIDDSMPNWQVYVLINGGLNPLTAAELRKAMYAEFEGYWHIDEMAKSEEWTQYFTPSAISREKGTEMLCRGLMSMEYGTQSSTLSSKSWLESSLDMFFEINSNEEILNKIKTYKKVLKVSREILGEAPFRRNNLFSGRISKVSKTMIEPISYVFCELRKKYSSAKLIQKQSELALAWDTYLSFEEDGSERILQGNTPQKFIARNEELLAVMLEVMADSQPRRGQESIIPNDLKITVLEKYTQPDGTILCGICNNALLDEITMDHIISVDDGGETTVENLQPAHRGCNSSKHSNSVFK